MGEFRIVSGSEANEPIPPTETREISRGNYIAARYNRTSADCAKIHDNFRPCLSAQSLIGGGCSSETPN